jgi:Domain of unknown function (DUF6316)
MSKHRKGEPPRRHYRSDDRCFMANGAWYFATREQIDVGPFPSREAAEAGVTRLLAMLEGVDDPAMARRLIEDYASRRAH